MKIFILTAMLVPTLAFAQTTGTQNRFDAASSKEKTGVDPERVICRTSLETGSLVKRIRRCMTSRQWAASIRGENQLARDLVRDNAGLVNGN